MKALIDIVVKLFYAGVFLSGLALVVLGGITISNGPAGVAASSTLGGLFVMWLSYCIGRMWHHRKAAQGLTFRRSNESGRSDHRYTSA